MTENKKNVIFIVSDAMRADRLSCTGYRRKGKKITPNLDKLAEEGVLFENAYSPGPNTRVAQPALLTGMHASNIGFPGSSKPLDDNVNTVAEFFKEEGYETRAYNMSLQIREELGFARGFDYFEDVPMKDKFELDFWHLEGMLWNFLFGRDCRTRYALKAMKRWIGGRNKEKPFFLFWNPTNPHNKYEAPRSFRKKFEREIEPDMNQEDIENVAGWGSGHDYIAGEFDLSDEEMDVVESRYDAEIAYMDYRIGELIDFLKDEDLYEDTIIVFTSDHGENFGERGMINHKYALNEALIHVPLIIRGHDFLDSKVSERCSTLDIVASVLKSATGAEISADSSKALVPEEEKRDYVFSEHMKPPKGAFDDLMEKIGGEEKAKNLLRGLKAGIKEDLKLVVDHRGKEEFENLGDGEKDEEALEEIRNSIESDLGSFGPEEEVDERSERVEDRLRQLGYF